MNPLQLNKTTSSLLVSAILASGALAQTPDVAVPATPDNTPVAPNTFEEPPVFIASEILQPELVAGPYHRVRASAPSDGYLIHFTVDSDFGTHDCVGIRELERRVGEIQAIAALVNISKGDLFAQGLKQSLEAPVDAAKNIVADPRESIRRLPRTVGHFFRKVGSSIEQASRSVENNIDQANATGDTVGAIGETGKGFGNAVKNVAGFDKARLNCARQLGVDPYSDNERLRSEMEKVTWAFFAGGLPLKIGAAAASAGVSVAITTTKVIGLPNDIYQATAGELALKDKQNLSNLGVAPDQINTVFLNQTIGTTLRHGIVESLASLPDGKGRAEVVTMLASASNKRRLAFLSDVLRQLAERHLSVPYKSLGLQERLPVGVLADGTVEVVAPIDYLSWTEAAATFATSLDTVTSKRLVLGGDVSEQASKKLAISGWEVLK